MDNDKQMQVIDVPSEKSLEQLKAEVSTLNQFYKGLMQKGTDYDIIPGTPKPTLLKSGAELLRLRFGFNPEFKISKGLTDIQKGFIEYDVTCSLYRNGILMAEGVGNANSLESKWRYRWVYPTDLPKDFDKTKAYETYGATRKTKQGGAQYRLENENPQDQANTILKIAKKRSFVDAILTATGASRIFTQDIEDMGIPPTTAAQDEPDSSKKLVDNTIGICPIHNVPWVDGRFGEYHWTDETKNGKKVACNRNKVEKEQAGKDIPADKVEPVSDATGEEPGLFEDAPKDIQKVDISTDKKCTSVLNKMYKELGWDVSNLKALLAMLDIETEPSNLSYQEKVLVVNAMLKDYNK